MTEHDEKTKTGAGSPEDAENIVGAALFAVGRGARGVWISLPAIQTCRDQFIDKVRPALQEPDWHDHWRREKAYVMAYAAAMGQRAGLLAKEDFRTLITKEDIETAMRKVRGRLPIAGRWCPL